VPRAKPPKLTSPAERADIADGAADRDRDYAPVLKALGIAACDRRRAQAQDMLQQVVANYLVADAVKAEETHARGRPKPWALFAMLDQLMGVADDLNPAAVRKRKHMCEFVNAFMVGAMRLKALDFKDHGSHAYKRLPDLRRLAQRREATEQARGDAGRWREIDKQNEQTDELLRKLRGLPPRGKPRLTRP
jgi:hypothetical protein